MANWLSYLFVWPQCAHFIILRPSSWWIKKIRNQRSQKVLKNVSVDCVFRPRSRWKGNHTNNNGWKCFPSCVISPFWPSIHNPNTIKAVLIAYLGQGADEKATTQTIFFWKSFYGCGFSPFWPSKHNPNTIKTLLLIAYLGSRASAWMCDQSTWAKAFLQYTIRIRIWKREKNTNTKQWWYRF